MSPRLVPTLAACALASLLAAPAAAATFLDAPLRTDADDGPLPDARPRRGEARF